MTNEQRESISDAVREPVLWYVYILRLEGGELYIGQTNDMDSRLVEHNLDAGSTATAGQEGELVFFTHTHSRESAKRTEERLRRTLQRSPLEIESIIEHFDRLVRLIRPEKTLAQLRQDEADYESEMRSHFHLCISSYYNPITKTACGWQPDGQLFSGRLRGGIHGTESWELLRQRERERLALKSVGSKQSGHSVCQRCLKLIPVDIGR